jgi:hypothetical protein
MLDYLLEMMYLLSFSVFFDSSARKSFSFLTAIAVLIGKRKAYQDCLK